MRDVHEELQLRVGQLLGMDMFLQAQTVLLLTGMLATIIEESTDECQQIDSVCKWRAVPRRMDDHTEAALGRADTVLLSHYAEIIVTRAQMTESYLVGTRLHTNPVLVIDAVAIDDMFGIVVGQRG